MNLNIKKYFYISSGLLFSWICFEYCIDSYYRKVIKKILKNNINNIYSDKYKSFYETNIDNIAKEIEISDKSEKDHIIYSLKKTFSSIDSLDSIVSKLMLYNENKINKNISNILKTENMLWYPHTCRFIFSCFNNFFLYTCQLKWNVKITYFGTNYIYEIYPKNNIYNKTIIIFNGLGGILNNFDKLFTLLIKKKYKIIIPLYGPTQASLNYNLDCHEAQYYNDIHTYLYNNNYNKVDIVAWSLGGILYKGFELYNKKYYSEYIKINTIILFEPLLGIRGCIDTYFSKLRSSSNTLSILNCMTSKKYLQYNNIFTYFIHSIIGYSTASSFGYFTSTEFKNTYINKNRYILLSSDDIVINDNIDSHFVNSNFYINNIFKRKGYHGGWLQSSQLDKVLDTII